MAGTHTAKTPAATVTLNEEELTEDEYSLTCAEGCTDAGVYQVTARLKKGILAGADTAEFRIE